MADLKTTQEDAVSAVGLGDMIRLALFGGGNGRATIAQVADAVASTLPGVGGTELRALTFTSDTGSTADSDPGAGLFKWNNATQSSATFLYVDNATADAVTITGFFSKLFPGGFLYIQQESDSTKWQMWRVMSIAAGSGYYKFGVTFIAGAAIADDEICLCDFKSGTRITIQIAISDESTAITTGTAKITFRIPFALTLTEIPRASLSTSSSSGNPAFDINEGGASIFSTTLTIDSGEKTSTTAATPAVLSDSSLADDAEITIDIDTAGTGAKGAKITLIGFPT